MDFEVVIIGAGVVGLAIAAKLSQTKKGIAVVEKNKKFGQETSSRNSEVIHSGIYYPKNSLKAKFCKLGRIQLYDYCKKNEIPFKKCGKYIVATNKNEVYELEKILEKARKNGVDSGRKITIEELKSAEPNVNAVAAIYFPESGIVDSHSLMKNLEKEAINNGVDFAYNSEVISIKKITKGYKISVSEEESKFDFTSKILINAAGLNSYKISAMLGLKLPEYKLDFWKGEYFAVGNGKNKLVNSLIYPVPNAEISLGIHATIDLNGGLKLGPNAIHLSENNLNCKVDKNNQAEFYKSAKMFLPFLEKDDLHPDQAGIRPKIMKNNNEFKDFIVKNEVLNGYENFINLIGIESPGLTASLSIANYIEKIFS